MKAFILLAATVAIALGNGMEMASGPQVQQLCKDVTKTIPTDLILVVDRSDSIANFDFDTLRSVLANFLEGGLELTNTTRVSLITFGFDVTMEFTFDDKVTFREAAAKINAIDRSTRNGGFTFTYDALEMAGDVLVPQSRPDANLFVLLFTDGESNGMEGATAYTIQVANQVKSMRAMKMIAVGVGPEVNEEELIGVSSDSILESTVFFISDYGKLKKLVDEVIVKETICSDIVITTTTTTSTTTTTTPEPTTTTTTTTTTPEPTTTTTTTTTPEPTTTTTTTTTTTPEPTTTTTTTTTPEPTTTTTTTTTPEPTTTTTAGPLDPCVDGTLVTRVIVTSNGDVERSTLLMIQNTVGNLLPAPTVQVRVHSFDGSPGSSLKDHLEGLIYDEEGHPIAKKIVVVAINKDVSDMKEFFTPLLELVDSATIVIPMDVTGVNGQYELRQLAKAGGYTESKCLFCGGLREYYLHKCGIELSEYLQC